METKNTKNTKNKRHLSVLLLLICFHSIDYVIEEEKKYIRKIYRVA